MRSLRVVFALALVPAGVGCSSSITVNHDFEPDVDFARFKTYAWIAQPAEVAGGAQAAQQTNTLLDQRIKDAVNGELGRKGLTIATDNPDLVVAYHTGVENKVDVTDWGYTYGSYYYGYPQRDITVDTYRQGTLIVDLIEYGTMELVWRGTAEAILLENPTPEKTEQRINQAVGMMFQKYPPKKS
jgi:hypothetical protein